MSTKWLDANNRRVTYFYFTHNLESTSLLINRSKVLINWYRKMDLKWLKNAK